MNRNSLALIIVAGGTGSRMNSDIPKQFIRIDNKEIIEHTIHAFQKTSLIDKYIVVCHKHYIQHMNDIMYDLCNDTPYIVVEGGNTRQESVYNGLRECIDYDYVMIHDAVRCCINPDDVKNLYNTLLINGACALGVHVTDTIKKSDATNCIECTVDRGNLWNIQTPQAFRVSMINDAHNAVMRDNVDITDDCSAAEYIGASVKIVEGHYDNIKVTTQTDLILASAILKGRE
ncbi:MAG: 2-C-methyl-D-erythritol 4-phosphate cytidylyltransferase [Clostridia bacterium]|nr:2-C-methyl-D-erythritol 4-phosphate cytidylyltransferase [Clostridia bacterium]